MSRAEVTILGPAFVWRQQLGGERILDEIGAAFADHDAGRVGVARHQTHHAGIGNIEALDAACLERRVDHRCLVPAHAAGANRVIDRIGAVADQFVERGIVVEIDRITVLRLVFREARR